MIHPPSTSCSANKPVIISDTQGVLSSHMTDTTGCGSSQSPWQLQAMPGQTFQLRLFDFGAESLRKQLNNSDPVHPSIKPVYGYITEEDLSPQPFYGSTDRDRDLFTSLSNVVKIQMVPFTERNINFIIQYKS